MPEGRSPALQMELTRGRNRLEYWAAAAGSLPDGSCPWMLLRRRTRRIASLVNIAEPAMLRAPRSGRSAYRASGLVPRLN